MSRRAAAVAAFVVALLAMAVPARAHVSVQPEEAEGGSSPTLTFRVPNERADATVKVEVFLPEGAGLSASPAPLPGWEATVDDTKVSWEGGPIPPEGSQEFSMTVGPLPAEGGSLVFKALQTYESGEVVRWIEEPEPGGEPEHPAPVLAVSVAPAAATTTASTTTTTAPTTTAAPVAGADEDDEGDGGPWVAIAVVVGALVAVGAAVIARRRRPDQA